MIVVLFFVLLYTHHHFFQSEQVESIPDKTLTSYDDEVDLIDLFADDDSVANNSRLNEDQLMARDRRLGRYKFKKVIREWVKWKINWRKLFSLKTEKNLCVIDDMMKLPMKPVMDIMEKANQERENIFGYLPLMCKNSPVQLGALSAQSFAERMISVGNLLITKKQTQLDNKLRDKLVVWQMN